MRYFSIILALLFIASSLIASQAEADTRYVGDQLIITLRQGKSTQHKILKTLETGTPVEVLEEDASYLRVRTSDGTEGYVLRQYISSNPPKSQRIDELEIEKNALQEKISELEKTKSTLEMQLKEIAEIEQNLEQALNNERIITEKYNTLTAQAENVVEIAQERDQLFQDNKKLASGIKELQKKDKKASDSRMIKWFLAGGGVFFFGWLTGKISRKKRSRF